MSTAARRDDVLDGMVGEHPAIQHIRDQVARVAPFSMSVLIQGPTGAGKEVVAKELHHSSGRSGAFVAFNVCAIPESMFEAALFGHVRGAFSGALNDSRGLIAEADGGTLCLDEIGGLPLLLQAKLLRVLETRTYRPLGGRRDLRSDFRTVATTNEKIVDLVADGRFREDLAYRLGAVTIEIPPLSARASDVPALVRHFISLAGAAGTVRLTPEAERTLMRYRWPGNVRELRNVVERAIALAESGLITPDTLACPPSQARTAVNPERAELLARLQASGWDTAAVADTLGVHWTTIYRRMRKLGISRQRHSDPVHADTRGRSASYQS